MTKSVHRSRVSWVGGEPGDIRAHTAERDLVPFGCLSEAGAHTIHYPNGDVTHCFALLFLTRAWKGDPLHPPTSHALELLAAYLRSGSFQVR